jgi:hypothetical protein
MALENCSKKLERSRGFYPRSCGSPENAITPDKVIQHYRVAQGRSGRPELSPHVF